MGISSDDRQHPPPDQPHQSTDLARPVETAALSWRQAIRALASAEELVADSSSGRSSRQRQSDRTGPTAGQQIPVALSDPSERAAHQPALDGARERLRPLVDDFVRSRRALGHPPERVLIELKSALANAFADPVERDMLARVFSEVITWSIESYFADADQS